MGIKLVIARKPFADVVLEDVYELVVGYKDSECTSITRSVFYTPMEVDTMKLFIELLKELDPDYIEDLRDEAGKFFKVQHLSRNDMRRLAEQFVKDMYLEDDTARGMGASIEDFCVYYWDKKGIKHNVKVVKT